MAIDYEKVLREGVGKLLRGEKPDIPPNASRVRDRDAEMRSWIQDQLHARGWKSAADLREEDRIAREQAAQQQAAIAEEEADDEEPDEIEMASPEVLAAWDAVGPTIRAGALAGRPDALAAWSAALELVEGGG